MDKSLTAGQLAVLRDMGVHPLAVHRILRHCAKTYGVSTQQKVPDD
jgi:hypothetical protein